MIGDLVAPRYVARFRCLAERCEDTCCRGLKVPLDERGFQRMREVMSGTPEERERFTRLVLPNERPSSAEHAFIARAEGGGCSFLGDDGLCSLQRSYGEAILGEACAMFPRVLGRVGSRLELTATLACPEIARLCLLDETGVELVPISPDLLPRLHVTRELHPSPADPCAARFDRLRAAALDVLSRRHHPLPARLVALAHVAYALHPLLSRGSPPLQDGGEGEARLSEALEAVAREDTLEAMSRNLAALELPSGACAAAFLPVVRSCLASPRDERAGDLARGLLEIFGGAGSPWDAYAPARDRLEARFAPRLEQYFRNYCVHHWFRSWHTEAPSLLAYLLQLTLRVALIRFVLAGSPRIQALLARPEMPDPEATAVLDQAAVEAFQISAKLLEPSEAMEQITRQVLSGGREDLLGKLLLFARFY